jgi:hypothetical protein
LEQFAGLSHAKDVTAESSCLAIAENSAGETKTVELPSLHVLDQTSKPEVFTLPADAPSQTRLIMCGRASIVPAPNDYKVLAAGFPLGIATNDEKPSRAGVLEMVKGQVQFRMLDGIMTHAEMKLLQSRLNAFQLVIDNPK